MTKDNNINSFTDLIAWQKGHFLVLKVYDITKNFSDDEKFGLTSQTRRCVISVTSNIAEGFGRKSKKHKEKFYVIAQGSLIALQNQLLIARDVSYIDKVTFSEVADQTVEVHKLLSGLIKGLDKM